MTTATSTAYGTQHLQPRTLPESMNWIWSQVMFPGRTERECTVRLRSLIVLIVVPVVLLYGQISYHLLEPDESRYAEIPREMLERGDWVVPYLQGQPYLDKPPLLYWLVMGSYRLFGVNDWAARLIPAIALHATVILVYVLGRRHLGERAAFWAALVLSVMPGFISMGRLLILDGLLTLWTTLATLAAFESIHRPDRRRLWWRVSWLAAGLGVLTKGPVSLILVLVPLALFGRLQNRFSRPSVRDYAEYVLGAVAVSLPWYVAIGSREPIFLRYFLWDHNVVRFFAPFDHIRPIWFYIPIVIAGIWPGTIHLFLLLASLVRHRTSMPLRPAELGYYLLAASWIVIFFSISGSKLPTYILPSFPLWALTIGWFVSAGSSWIRRTAVVLASLSFGTLVWLHYHALPWYAQLRSPMGEPEKVIPYCSDPTQPVLCFPRSCDSVAFYLRRDDLRNIRSKNFPELIERLRQNPRTVLLCTHRHSFESLRDSLPPDLKITTTVSFRRPVQVGDWFDKLVTETPWGLCDLVVIERTP